MSSVKHFFFTEAQQPKYLQTIELGDRIRNEITHVCVSSCLHQEGPALWQVAAWALQLAQDRALVSLNSLPPVQQEWVLALLVQLGRYY